MSEDYKWCPFVRFQVTENNQTWQNRVMTNRGEFADNGQSNFMCIEDRCACWNGNKKQCGMMLYSEKGDIER